MGNTRTGLLCLSVWCALFSCAKAPLQTSPLSPNSSNEAPKWTLQAPLLGQAKVRCGSQPGAAASSDTSASSTSSALLNECPTAVGLLASLETDSVKQCTAFLVDVDMIATSPSCIPEDLRTTGADCRGRMEMIFPENGTLPEEKLECLSIAQVSQTPADRSDLIASPEVALIRLKRGSERTPLTIKKNGVEPGDATSYRVETLSNTSVVAQIVASKCTTLQKSLLLPGSISAFSPVFVTSGCNNAPGSAGSPLVRNGQVLGILQGMPAQTSLFGSPPPSEVLGVGQYSYATNLSCVDTSLNLGASESSPNLDIDADNTSLNPECAAVQKISQRVALSERNWKALEPEAAQELVKTFNAWSPELKDRPKLNFNEVLKWEMKSRAFDPAHPEVVHSYPSPKCFNDPRSWFKRYRFRLSQRKTAEHSLWIPLWRPIYQQNDTVPSVDIVPEYWLNAKIKIHPHQVKREETGPVDMTVQFKNRLGTVTILKDYPISLCN